MVRQAHHERTGGLATKGLGGYPYPRLQSGCTTRACGQIPRHSGLEPESRRFESNNDLMHILIDSGLPIRRSREGGNLAGWSQDSCFHRKDGLICPHSLALMANRCGRGQMHVPPWVWFCGGSSNPLGVCPAGFEELPRDDVVPDTLPLTTPPAYFRATCMTKSGS